MPIVIIPHDRMNIANAEGVEGPDLDINSNHEADPDVDYYTMRHISGCTAGIITIDDQCYQICNSKKTCANLTRRFIGVLGAVGFLNYTCIMAVIQGVSGMPMNCEGESTSTLIQYAVTMPLLFVICEIMSDVKEFNRGHEGSKEFHVERHKLIDSIILIVAVTGFLGMICIFIVRGVRMHLSKGEDYCHGNIFFGLNVTAEIIIGVSTLIGSMRGLILTISDIRERNQAEEGDQMMMEERNVICIENGQAEGQEGQ